VAKETEIFSGTFDKFYTWVMKKEKAA